MGGSGANATNADLLTLFTHAITTTTKTDRYNVLSPLLLSFPLLLCSFIPVVKCIVFHCVPLFLYILYMISFYWVCFWLKVTCIFGLSWLLELPLARAADLTLVPSAALAKELEAARVTTGNKIRLWNKGVDFESFHPKYRSQEMRIRLSNGEPERPLIVHVGRLGVEKKARIAFIGDGSYREDLEKLFSDMPAVFTGMLGGEELSQAYASGDVFVMPLELETLGHIMSFSENSLNPRISNASLLLHGSSYPSFPL
ncbi:Sulfoquinovosyl transferase SQD2 [Camellia lanceoleosa]|uniref:Sulfoquinovosyl transferase SQD2 n=1 Tax=Camellia lanceoleosa TaxID=1840588 RepID=A0ACC0G1K5_9ERIC|nr:Sulfoquinovosyl transferase SQD2 [Camellia lanceoleosa]